MENGKNGSLRGMRQGLPAYYFQGKRITDPEELVLTFARHWEEGKKELSGGNLTAYFRRFAPDLARKCQAAAENGIDDVSFWRLLYQIDPKHEKFYWQGQIFESTAAFGKDMLNRLWDKDESQFPYYAGILSAKLLSAYAGQADPGNERLKTRFSAIEDSCEAAQGEGTDLRCTYYRMAYTLSGEKILLLNGEPFKTVGELAAYMQRVLAESTERFKALCHRIVDAEGNLDPQVEAWLIALGKQKEIEEWRASLN